MNRLTIFPGLVFAITLYTSSPAFCQDTKVQFINTTFENASPFNWQIDSTGTINIELIYDHERGSINRANQHWHFQLHATPGSDLTIILKNFENIWNRDE